MEKEKNISYAMKRIYHKACDKFTLLSIEDAKHCSQ